MFKFIFVLIFINLLFISGKRFDNLTGTIEDYNKLVQVLPEKDILFITGWPHSGTTITNVIYDHFQDYCSTMIEKCLEKYEYCGRINYEGQWLLFHVSNEYRSGKTCPIQRSEELDKQILQTVSLY